MKITNSYYSTQGSAVEAVVFLTQPFSLNQKLFEDIVTKVAGKEKN